MCGDSLDVQATPSGGATIVTGSWRPENPLELWDLGTGKVLEQIDWKNSLLANQPCQLYAAQFSKASPHYIAAGGSGANEARVFEKTETGETTLVGTVAGLPRGVFTIDWSPVSDRVAIGSGDGTIRILDVVDRNDDTTAT